LDQPSKSFPLLLGERTASGWRADGERMASGRRADHA